MKQEADSCYEGTNEVPRNASGTVLHVDVKEGDVANRIITVGDPARAERISKHFDKNEKIFFHSSGRGFTTYTGKYNGVPISIVAIGMGISMMDFFVREVRNIVTGPMLCVRFGTCGGLKDDVPAGSISVASTGSVKVMRNPDAFPQTEENKNEPEYFIFGVQKADEEITEAITKELKIEIAQEHIVSGMNASAESFYSSQGRKDPNFDDANHDIIETLIKKHEDVTSMEMETFQLFALANSSRGTIRASGASIIVANRSSGIVCSEEILKSRESEGGLAVIKALCKMTL